MVDKRKYTEFKVLIIEDDRPLRKALKNVIYKSGFTVIDAEDGEIGLKTALEERPNIILLDMMMPNMGGPQFLGEIQNNPWGKTVPIIILTNVRYLKSLHKTLDVNVVDYVVKVDWTLEDLISKIKSALSISG